MHYHHHQFTFSVFSSNANMKPERMMHLFTLSITLLPLFFPTTFQTTARLSIDCGSAATSAEPNGREWIGDIRPKVPSLLQIKGPSTASPVAHSSVSADHAPHNTARISPSQFSYTFQLSPGEKILRLHFNPVPYKGFKRFNDMFSVEAEPFTLLGNFSASLTAAALGVKTFAKEFCISIEQTQTLSITFSPVASRLGDQAYAFINGIEIIPVPSRLSYFKGGDHRARVLGQRSLDYIDNSTALELTYRVNVNMDYVSMSDQFYDKAKKSENNILTWKTPVDVGFRYLIRIHFSDLGLPGLSLHVLVNEMIVDDNLSIEKDRYDVLRYRDYAVAVKGRKEEGRRDLSISLQSRDEFVDGDQLIKGFEIFKLSNYDNSLASPNAIPRQRDYLPQVINYSLSILCQGNATLAIAMLVLINVIVHKLREIYEARSVTEEENKPSARAERLCRRFSLAEIRSATKSFSEALFLGRGGFGRVYMGFIDDGREMVAVKRLKSNSTQGKHEFLTEIETLSELRHINLVSLIGYCIDHKEMILVYEYMPGGTLADHLFKYAREGNDSCPLTWKQRLNICIGTARGLEYLHTGHGVIHRDVKASNILLDENLVAKVSDFGLAKLEDRRKLQSHISTKVKGTRGYLDPYYAGTGKLTRKSDTYAFGVVLLEVLCGRRAIDPMLGEDEYFLTRWAHNKINEGEADQIVDSRLLEEILPDSLKVFVEVAERCLHDAPKKRPTMSQIVVQLESALEHQESGKTDEPNHIAFVENNVCPSNEGMMPSENTERSAEASENVHTDTSPPTKQSNSNLLQAGEDGTRKPTVFKPRLSALDALWNRLKPSKRKELTVASEFRELDIRLPKFDYSELVAATNQFSSTHIIGSGGFATVYKAVLGRGRTVTVKRFSISRQELFHSFRNEIHLIYSLHHRNIIRLIGYCIHRNAGMLLYEFMENGSLDALLSDEQRCRQLQWSVRFKIIIGIAKGVIYLHQETRPRTMHRDLKPSHILLDKEMNPKISGFGLARNLDDDESELSTRTAGTIGYIAPENAMRGIFSEKSDVFSFGIVVLETMSRMASADTEIEVYALRQWGLDEWVRNVADLVGEFSEEEALRCIQVGLLCTQFEPQQRPTMASALKMLLGEDPALHEKMAQAEFHFGIETECGDSDDAQMGDRTTSFNRRTKIVPL